MVVGFAGLGMVHAAAAADFVVVMGAAAAVAAGPVVGMVVAVVDCPVHFVAPACIEHSSDSNFYQVRCVDEVTRDVAEVAVAVA